MSERINYNFEISGSGRRKSPATLTVNYTFSFNNNDEILYEGSKTYTEDIDENGNLENGINFVINETVTKRSAEFVISADYNLSTSKNNVTFSKNSLSISEKVIPVWVEFNDYGELKNANLSGLVDGYYFFYQNQKIVNFSYDLSSLTSGYFMFQHCSNLTTFSSDLSSLTDGYFMFDNCKNLTTFSSDLPSLTRGDYMFDGCENLSNFSVKLENLKSAYHMFYKCKINANSLQQISLNIKDLSSLNRSVKDDWKYYNGTSYSTISDSYRGRFDVNVDENSVSDDIIEKFVSDMKAKKWDVYIDNVLK